LKAVTIMPFENEFASYEPLRRILDNKKIEELQNRLIPREQIYNTGNIKPTQIDVSAIEKSDFLPDMILAIDGSFQSVPIKNGFPDERHFLVYSIPPSVKTRPSRL